MRRVAGGLSWAQAGLSGCLQAIAGCGGGADTPNQAPVPRIVAPPTASLTAPATATTGVAVTLIAAAADSDGSVARVAFYDGSTLLGEDTTAPYTWAWTPSASGSHSLSARAIDDGGASTTSAAVVVTLSAATADTQVPTLSVTSPTNYAAALSGTVAFSATASDNVGVASVEFQVDGVPLGAALTAPPCSVNVDTTLHASGPHVLRARARDAAGNLSAWAALSVQFSGTRTQPAGVTRNESWATGLNSATAFAQAPDGRILVTEQGGAPAGSGPGGFFGFVIVGGSFYPAAGSLPAPWRGSYFFADYVNRFIGAVDLANGNAGYAFGSVSGNPVDVLAAADGALLVLTRSSIARFSAP